MPRLEIRADSALPFPTVVCETRDRLIRLVDVDLEIDDERFGLDRLDLAHARIDRGAVRDPVALLDRFAADKRGDFRDRRNPQIDCLAESIELDFGPIGSPRTMRV